MSRGQEDGALPASHFLMSKSIKHKDTLCTLREGQIGCLPSAGKLFPGSKSGEAEYTGTSLGPQNLFPSPKPPIPVSVAFSGHRQPSGIVEVF